MQSEHYKVTTATLENIPDILEILDKHLISNQKEIKLEYLENEGFVHFSFSASDLRGWLSDDDYIVLVCLDKSKLVGYCIGCDIDKTANQMQSSFITLLESSGEFNAKKIFYHKLIVTESGNNGIGSKLMTALLKELKKRDYDHVICLIAQEPYQNTKSIAFHQKLAFNKLERFKTMKR